MNCIKTKVRSGQGWRLCLSKNFLSLTILFTLFFGICTLWLPGDVCAEQVHISTHNNDDGSYNELWYSEDHDIYYIKEYDKNGNLKNVYVGVNPSPDDDTGTGGDPREIAQSLMDMLKKQGGNVEYEPNFWSTPLGQALIKTGKGPQPGDPIDPPDDGLGMDADGLGGSGSGGIDPSGGSIKEQIGKNKGKGSDDDDDDDDDKPGKSSLWGEEYAANPELVNPPPIYKIEFKSGKSLRTLQMRASMSSEATFPVINSGFITSKSMSYSVECRQLSRGVGKCPRFDKNGMLTPIGAKSSKDIKVKLASLEAGEYRLILKLANGKAQTLKLNVVEDGLKEAPSALESESKMKIQSQLEKTEITKDSTRGQAKSLPQKNQVLKKGERVRVPSQQNLK